MTFEACWVSESMTANVQGFAFVVEFEKLSARYFS